MKGYGLRTLLVKVLENRGGSAESRLVLSVKVDKQKILKQWRVVPSVRKNIVGNVG